MNEINKMLLDGSSNREVARVFELKEPTVRRHHNKHLVPLAVQGIAESMPDFAKLNKEAQERGKRLEVIGTDVESDKVYYAEYDKLDVPIKNLVGHIEFLYKEAVDTMFEAKKDNNLETRLRAIREARECLGFVKGCMDMVLAKDEEDSFDALVGRILDAVEEFPEAREQIAAKLVGEM